MGATMPLSWLVPFGETIVEETQRPGSTLSLLPGGVTRLSSWTSVPTCKMGRNPQRGLNMGIPNLLCAFITLILAVIHPLIHQYVPSSYCEPDSVLGMDAEVLELEREGAPLPCYSISIQA